MCSDSLQTSVFSLCVHLQMSVHSHVCKAAVWDTGCGHQGKGGCVCILITALAGPITVVTAPGEGSSSTVCHCTPASLVSLCCLVVVFLFLSFFPTGQINEKKITDVLLICCCRALYSTELRMSDLNCLWWCCIAGVVVLRVSCQVEIH